MSLTERLRSVGQELAERVGAALSGDHRMHGVQVRVTNRPGGGSSRHLIAKIDAALGLIARHQPMRLRRMRRDLSAVWVRPINTNRAAFLRESRTCILDAYFVDTFPAELIASSIVHEAMHARIQASGIRSLLPPDEERACRRAELKFGLSIPGGEAVVERARGALTLSDREVAPTYRPNDRDP